MWVYRVRGLKRIEKIVVFYQLLGYLPPPPAAALRSESSPLIVFSPPSPPAVSPLSVAGGLEMELFVEAEPSPLACYPPAKLKRKVGERSPDWILQMLEEFSLFVGHSCDGFEENFLTLFTDIIASNEVQGAGSCSKVGKEGARETNGLFSSNYDARSGNVSRGRSKGRIQRGFT
jgi:hypothetical protein